MSDTVRLTEADLRAAIRDPRYWRPNPDRESFAAWVTDGYRVLGASRLRAGDGSAIVHVRAYTRTRNGAVQQIAAHTRAAPPAGEGNNDLLIPVGRRSDRRHGRMAERDMPLLLYRREAPSGRRSAPARCSPSIRRRPSPVRQRERVRRAGHSDATSARTLGQGERG